MARFIDGDTDLEMTRYNEAAQIKQYSGLSPTTVRGGMMRYDPITKSDAVYVDLPSGGKLRIGDRPVQMAQADTLTTRTDATAAAPAALVPTATPAPVSLRPTETPAAAPAARQPIAEYDAQLRAGSDKAPRAADFEAGGYTAEEFAKYQQSLQGPEMVPVKLTPDQMAQYAQQPGAETVAPERAGLGSSIQSLIYNALDPKREATGGVADVVRSAFSKLPGTEDLDPGDLRFFSNLFTDFVDIGVSPVGAAMSMDEGGTMMKQGWNLLSSGDSEKMTSGAVDMTVGAALSALGVAEFVPYVKSLSEPVRGTLRQMSPQAKNLLADAIGASRAITQGDKDMLMEIFQPAGTPRSLGAATPTDLIKPTEIEVISKGVPPESAQTVQDQVARQKASYPSQSGWAQDVMEVAKIDPKKDKFEVVYKEVPYNFDKPPTGVSPEDWQKTMAQRQVEEIRALADRVKANDPAAIAIVKEANWYRTMRASLRKEFGGMGDVFADVLGATSAQTGVEMNWNNAIEVMRRFSRGEFDKEISMYDEMLKKGDVNPTTLGQMHNDPENPFRLITNAAGSLFNANSPAATKALFDMFRVATGAPKTPNFTGNLIGYTNAATIDVWAARHLRRLAGLDRLPPPVEKGVVGKHLKGSTLEQPNISGEFGFGQKVMADAANQINQQGIISSVAPNLQAMNPDDLQAVAWFIEKEQWTKNGWTSKAGEGGSFEFESSLAGAPDPAKVKELRRATTASFKPPPQRKTETADQYAARVELAKSAHAESVSAAQKQLDETKAPLARYVLGISVERPGLRPTNIQQADVAARLGEPAKADPSVVTYQINNTYGRFMQSDERAFNAEFVVRKNFDPQGVTRRMVEVAKEADQDAAFISKVVPVRTAESRPGVEIYFRKRQDADFARRLSDKLTQYGVDGFTFVTDSRVMDRPSAQAGLANEAVAGINGLRFQYIPEFDMGRDAWAAMSPAQRAAKIDEVEDLFDDITRDIVKTEPGISDANLMHYETNVIEKGKYDEYLK